jgi:hypothetical protein
MFFLVLQFEILTIKKILRTNFFIEVELNDKKVKLKKNIFVEVNV